MPETNKSLKRKKSPGRPKERQDAKRRSLYIENDVWRKLEFCAFVQKRPISKIVEEASLKYLNDQEFFKHIDWNSNVDQFFNS